MKEIQVIKRDGKIVQYDRQKIMIAIQKAWLDVEGEIPAEYILENIAKSVENYIEFKELDTIEVEKIQDLVEDFLIEGPKPEVAKAYIRYRQKHNMARDKYKELMNTIAEKLNAENVQNQNANVDEYSFGGRMGEMNSAVARKYALDYIVSPMARENHLGNMIYIHDLDNYAVGSHNCLTIPFDDLLAKGFNTRQTDVRLAQSVSTAFQLVAVIFQLQSLQQFGGVSASHIDWTMVPYVRKSFAKHFKDGLIFIEGFKEEEFPHWKEWSKIPLDAYNTWTDNGCDKKAYEYAMKMTEREVYQAVEAMYHNLNTLQSRSGNQLK